MFERYAFRFPWATQAAWMIALTVVLQPLLNLLDERLRSSGYVRIDETPVQVLNSDTRYDWRTRTRRSAAPPAASVALAPA